jgi:hypothetical protein
MWRRAAIACAVAGGIIVYAAVVPPSGPRSLKRFDANRMADLELRMWQAYYANEKVRLFGLLVTMLREQYRYSWSAATIEGFHLARAAATFGDATSNYDAVLPDLEAAYGAARDWVHGGFEPGAVARAELAWWVARRNPEHNSASEVGGLMADEYALLYEVPRERVARAALLRAEAAALRDAEPGHPDWNAIGELLRQSYAELLADLTSLSARGADAVSPVELS